MIVSVVTLLSSSSVMAENLKLQLKEIGADKDVALRNVKYHRDFYFTKPDNWVVQPSSKIVLTFQHSAQLLPERSSLNVMINGQVIKSIQLNKGNAAKNTTSIPLSPKVLKDFNKLTFDVDQHYTYKCEDPFDPALWTTVLNTSSINIDYKEVTPNMDFALFPFPVMDVLDYKPTITNYVIPQMTTASDDTLTAMGMVNAFIAQKVSYKDMKILVSLPDKINDKGSMIVIGTPEENRTIKDLASSLPLKLSGNAFQGKDGKELTPDAGVLMMVANPSNKAEVVLIVSGNSPAGVLKAAKVLTQLPTRSVLKGPVVLVDEALKNEFAELRDWPGWVRNKKTTLANIGIKSQTTRGVTSVPIKETIKIMPDITMPPKNFAKLKIVYSYAAHLEASQSELEFIWNNVSMHSAKLTNPEGENLAELEIEIPAESIKIYNEAIFKYHLFPVKYDMCRFTSDEQIWGTIHNITSFEFPAQIKTVIPDIGLINDGGYPFTAYPDLQDDVVVLADDYNAYDVYGMLWFIARLAKMTKDTDAQNVSVVREKNLAGTMKNSKNIVAIGTNDRNGFIKSVKPELRLIYDDSFKILRREKQKDLAKLRDIPDMGVVEQLLSPWNDRRVVTILYGQDNKGLKNAISLFSDDAKFEKIQRGNIVAVTADSIVKTENTLTKEQARALFGEQVKRTAATADFWWGILKTFLIIVGIIAILRILFEAFLRGARGQPNIRP